MSNLLVSFHYPSKSREDIAADFFYTPARNLFGGRDVYVVPTMHQQEFSLKFEEIESSQEHNWLQTVCDIALLVPGLVLGAICSLFGSHEEHRQVADAYNQAPKQQVALRPAKNIYFTVDYRIRNLSNLSPETNPIHWDVIKNRYAANAKIHQVEHESLKKPVETEDNDLYLVFKAQIINLFHADSHDFAHHGKRTEKNPVGFLHSKGFQNKTIIFDYTLLSNSPRIDDIKTRIMRCEQWKEMPELHQYPLEVRSVEYPFWFKK